MCSVRSCQEVSQYTMTKVHSHVIICLGACVCKVHGPKSKSDDPYNNINNKNTQNPDKKCISLHSHYFYYYYHHHHINFCVFFHTLYLLVYNFLRTIRDGTIPCRNRMDRRFGKWRHQSLTAENTIMDPVFTSVVQPTEVRT